MIANRYIILYVANPLASETFYNQLLEQSPIESSSTFVLYTLSTETRLGLWRRDQVTPEAYNMGGGGEVAFSMANDQMVDETYQRWISQGVTILQDPVKMDFGYTFLALDPDGHRLRVFARSL